MGKSSVRTMWLGPDDSELWSDEGEAGSRVRAEWRKEALRVSAQMGGVTIEIMSSDGIVLDAVAAARESP